VTALNPTTPGMPRPGADRAAALARVAPALGSLRKATSLPMLFSHATRALCDEMGFQRAALFTLRDHALVAESVHVRGAPDEGDRLLTRLAGTPAPLRPSLYESEVLRRRMTLLVVDAVGDARALAPLPGTRSYVAAPVICEAYAVTLLHADHGPHGPAVTELDRRALWAFAEGLGYALERCLLEERLRRHSSRVLALVRSTEASVEELVTPAATLPDAGGDRLVSPAVALPPGMPRVPGADVAAMPERERLEMLTRREREVLAMLAEGETNARIAKRLVVSEDTVKTHVKHILRKLAVHNRSQAISRYFQTRGLIVDHALSRPASGFG
jgi:LuxR family transcriptional regulator, regulator of acetate metabolism